MSQPHNNPTDAFPELHTYKLEEYAAEWVEKYSSIQIDRVLLYRCNVSIQDRTGEKFDNTQPRIPSQYAVVFEISNCNDVEETIYINIHGRKIVENILEFHPIDYPTEDDDCTRFMKYCRQVSKYKIGGHPFLNSAFPPQVYKKSEPEKFYKEWLFFYKRENDQLSEIILKEKRPLILFPISGKAVLCGKQDQTQNERPDEVLDNDTISDDLLEDVNKVFPCEAGTQWNDIIITLIDNETVRIKTPQGEGRFTYHQLRMNDARVGNKPKMIWGLLRLFAHSFGNITRDNPTYDPKISDTAKRLNKHLKELFGINDSIFQGHYKKMKGYKTKIIFSDQTNVVS